MRRYSLEKATELICGTDSGLSDPRRWVVRRLRSGQFPGIKIGRSWFMTGEQIAAAIDACGNQSSPQVPVAQEPALPDSDINAGLSVRARRRIGL